MIFINNGHLEWISDSSGHYTPDSAHFGQAITELYRHGFENFKVRHFAEKTKS